MRTRDFYGGVPRDVEKMFSVKVDNLSGSIRMDDLYDNFKIYGNIGDIYMPRHRDTGKTKGFAFIRFYKRHDGESAIKEMDGHSLCGSVVTVSWAKRERVADPPVHKGRHNSSRGSDRNYRSRSPRSVSYSRSLSSSPARKHHRSDGHSKDRRRREQPFRSTGRT